MEMRKYLVTFVLSAICQSAFGWRIDLPGGGEWRGDDPGQVVGGAVEAVRSDPTKVIVNPAGFINRSGIPTQGDFVEFVVREPDKVIELTQNPGNWPYVPVASAMVSGRNAVVTGGANRIPPQIASQLRRWYSDDLLNSIRWTTNWGPLQHTLQAAQMSFNPRTRAITLINAVVFRDDIAANDAVLWAHEVFHVQQYRDWGVFGFAKRWVENSSDTGPVEGPAYARQQEANDILAGVPSTGSMQVRVPVMPAFPAGFGMQVCGCWGPNPSPLAPEPRCASGSVRVNICPGMCAPGHPQYAYVCM